MIWGGIQRTSTLDFPGALCCVLFTKGCDLDCFYCHNRALIARGISNINEEEIWSFLVKRQGLLDGVVISGGEPTLQKGLDDFLARVKNMAFRTKLDTNGQHPEVLTTLCQAGLLDYIAVDIKALPAQYGSVCRREDGFGRVKMAIEMLLQNRLPFEARTTLYPGMTLAHLSMLLSLFPPLPKWRLNYFKMPAKYLDHDEKRLHDSTLTPAIIRAHQEGLLTLQPNLIGI